MVLFENGYLTVDNSGDATFDDKGNIIVPTPDISNTILCQIDSSRTTSTAREGEVASINATVYVNKDDAPSDFAPKKVRLYHNKKGFLGEFGVINIEWYDITQAWVLTV